MEIILDSIITCPECGHKETEKMPVNACSGVISARVVAGYLHLRKVIVVFFVLLALFHVRQFIKVRALVVRRKKYYKSNH
jgi:hypothetical protein